MGKQCDNTLIPFCLLNHVHNKSTAKEKCMNWLQLDLDTQLHQHKICTLIFSPWHQAAELVVFLNPMKAEGIFFVHLLINRSPKPTPEEWHDSEILLLSYPCHHKSAVLTRHNAAVCMVYSVE
jgi:hypothetical protein